MVTSFFKRGIAWLLLIEARMVLAKYKPKVIAITGSVGKTSTKDAIYAVVAAGAHARKSDKSFNSELGIPLTILGCPNAWHNPFRWLANFFHGLLLIIFPSDYPEWLILEVGADKPGDIRSVAGWLTVDIAVITRLPEVPVHVEFFASAEAVLEEKASLIEALKPGGTLVVYGDEERSRMLATRAEKRGCGVVLFGLSKDSLVRGSTFQVFHDSTEAGGELWPAGMVFSVEVGKHEQVEIQVRGILGSHMTLPFIAAAAVGMVLERSSGQITDALRGYEPPPGRMRLLRGLKDSLLIDDTYNSSPAAAAAALEALHFVTQAQRKIVVLGDMLELGRYSVEEHRKLGVQVAHSAQYLVTIGPRARDIAQGALDVGMPDASILQYENAQIAGMELKNIVMERDCVLIKGSQGVRMERTVAELLLHPEEAGELLVRQNDEWLRKQ